MQDGSLSYCIAAAKEFLTEKIQGRVLVLEQTSPGLLTVPILLCWDFTFVQQSKGRFKRLNQGYRNLVSTWTPSQIGMSNMHSLLKTA